MSDAQYDEPGSRTRQAWLRSALGMSAVAILIERGVAARGMPLALGLVALAPAIVFVAAATRRSVELGPHDSAGPRRSTVLITAVAVIGLAATAAVSVLAT
jgi:Domain of unknown function (DUF202)